MELHNAPRMGLSLDALIAEAKRRARQRRLLLSLLILAVGAAAAGLVLGLSGGGPQSRNLAGLGNKSGASQSTSQTPHYVIPHFTGGHGPLFKSGNASCEISWNRYQSQAACVTAASNTLPASLTAVARQRLLALRRARPIGYCGSQTFPFEDEKVMSVACMYSAPPSPTH